MSEEKWVTNIKDKIGTEIELNLWSLKRLAEQNDVELSYVLEIYRNNMVHKINRILKECQ